MIRDMKKNKRKQAYLSLDYLFFTLDWEIIFAQWEEVILSQPENVNNVKYMS